MKRDISFSIDAVEKTNDRLFIGGRCHGSDIRIGDVFTTLSNEQKKHTEPSECKLEVIAILTYKKYIDQLSHGMTAELELKEDFPCEYQTGFCLYGYSNLELDNKFKILGNGEFHVKIV